MLLLKLMRKIARVLRGSARKPQIIMAVTLGVIGGFALGFNLTFVLVLLLLLLLNANFVLFMTSLAVGKTCALLLAPVTFQLGAALLEIGPIRALVRTLVNAPVTALLGLEKYVLLGGLPVGVVLGVALGVGAARAITTFRRKLLSLEEGSEKWNKFNRNILIRFLKRVLFGKRKGDYAKLAEDGEHAKIVRQKGVVVLVVAVALIALVAKFALPAALKKGVERGLGWANGAEVNLADVDISLLRGRLYLKGFQMADPDNLDRNLIEFKKMGASVSIAEMLRKRVVVNEAVIARVRLDTKRETPARRIGAREDEQEEEKVKEPAVVEGTPLADYMKEGERIVARLRQIKRALDRLERVRKSKREAAEKKAKEKAERVPYGNMVAAFLLEERPRVVIKRVAVEEIGPVGNLTCELRDLSNEPALHGEPVVLMIAQIGSERKGTVAFNVHREDAPNDVELNLPDIPLHALAGELSEENTVQFQQGTVSVSCTGTFSSKELYLPLEVNVTGLVAKPKEGNTVLGLKPEQAARAMAALKHLKTTILVHGSLTSPRVRLDTHGLLAELRDALVQAAKDEAASRLEEKADEVLKKLDVPLPVDKLKSRLRKLGGKAEKKEESEENEEKNQEEKDEEDKKKDRAGKLLDLLK